MTTMWLLKFPMATVWLWLTALILLRLPVSVYCAESRDDIIKRYFACGFSYKIIIGFLHFVHGISLSLRQLKRRLCLRRRQAISRTLLNRTVGVMQAHIPPLQCKLYKPCFILIQEELRGSGRLLGYRSMWRRLQVQHGLSVPRFVR